MDDFRQNYGCASTGCGLLSLILAVAVGWLVYGSLGSGFWVALLWLALGLTALLGFIPVAGPFLYWRLATHTVMPTLLNAFGLSTTWLTTAILWIGLIGSIVWTIVVVVLLIGLLIRLSQS